jgi:hypothetical protein
MNSNNLNEQIKDIKIDNLLNDINLQTKIIKILLDPMQHYFREQVFDIMDVSFFESNMHRVIVKYASRYIYKYNSIPNIDTLKIVLKQNVKEEKNFNNNNKNKVKGLCYSNKRHISILLEGARFVETNF